MTFNFTALTAGVDLNVTLSGYLRDYPVVAPGVHSFKIKVYSWEWLSYPDISKYLNELPLTVIQEYVARPDELLSVDIVAELADGSALPSWIKFDTGQLSFEFQQVGEEALGSYDCMLKSTIA